MTATPARPSRLHGRVWVFAGLVVTAACHRSQPPPDRYSEEGSWLDVNAIDSPWASSCDFAIDGPDTPARTGLGGLLGRLLGKAENRHAPIRSPGTVQRGYSHASLRCFAQRDVTVIPRVDLALKGAAGAVGFPSQFAFESLRSGEWRSVEFRLNEQFLGLATVTPEVGISGYGPAVGKDLPPFYALGTGRSAFAGDVSLEALERVYADSLGARGAVAPARPEGGGATVEICAASRPRSGWEEVFDNVKPGGPPCTRYSPFSAYGGISLGEAQGALRPHQSELRGCVRSEGAVSEATRAIRIELVVKDRRARGVSVASSVSSLAVPPGVARCVERVLEAVSFPGQADDAVTFVSLTSTTETPDGRAAR